MKYEILENLIYFIMTYIVFVLIYTLIINRKRKDYKTGKKQTEIIYIINKFKLDMNKTKYNVLKWGITFINPLIISITFVIVINIKSFTFGLLVGFVVMLLLVYACYEIFGRILKKKEGK